MAHNYEVGTRAWQPDPTEGWVASEVKEKLVDGDKVQLVFILENGETKSLETTQAELQVDNNPKLPPLMNPAMLEASEDLTNLSHLNEPAVLQAIKLRGFTLCSSDGASVRRQTPCITGASSIRHR